MTMRNLLAATALGTSLIVGGAAMAASTVDKTQSQTQTQGTTGAAGTMNNSATGSTVTTGTASHWFSAFKAGDLEGKNVRNQTGDEVGEIQKIVRDSDGEYHAVVSVGGFLGIGDKDVLIPMSRMTMGEDDVILLSSEDEDQLKAMPAFDQKVAGYTEVKSDQMLGM